MAENSYDVVIIGGGPGGYPAAIRGAQLGLRIAVVEKEQLGGICLHKGCIPTKALLESAEHLHHARDESAAFGVVAPEVSFDYGKVLERKSQVVAQLHKGVQGLLKRNKVDVFYGAGSLTSPQTVHVAGSDGTHDLRATNVVIATGSRPRSLPGLELNGTTVISSDHALELTELPESIIILGAGAVGVEWASLFHDFGVAVTVVEIMPTLVPLEDKDIGRELGRSFSRRGITVKTNAKLLVDTLQAAADSVAVEIEVEGERESLQADLLLVAVGRTGNVEELGLDAVGVSTESGVIPIDEYGRTNVPHVYAIGDVAGGYLLAHKATAEGHIVVEHLAGEETHPLDPLRVPRATYCRPEIASVGLLEEEAAAQGREVKVGRFPFAALGKALIKGKTEGFVKMVCDATTDEILGTHVIGPNATDIVAEMGLAQLLEATPLEVGLNVHPHPTLAEAIMEASWDVDRRAVHVFRRR
ncbi:MAG: dihydrolipoyl dehydrogenase [Chloroflexota bacterium]|nr:dihydrolipoyl dehydrogenase [Chloroflexota bacterium]MDE2929620.1 dihydrolipoyl dehydrogenase [Chloroflexota bacterium]